MGNPVNAIKGFANLNEAKNGLINSNFAINQRYPGMMSGSQILAAPFTHYADRWYVANSGMTGNVYGYTFTDSNYWLWEANAASSGAALQMMQNIEAIIAARYAGKKASLGYTYSSLSATQMTVSLSYANSKDNFVAVTQFYSSTVAITNDGVLRELKFENIDVPAQATNGVRVRIHFDNFAVTGILRYHAIKLPMFNVGATLLPWSLAGENPIDEYELCKRYFQKSFQNAQGPAIGATQCYVFFNLTTQMRAVPVVSFLPGANLTNAIDETGTSPRTPNAIAQINNTTTCMGALLTVPGGGMTLYRPCRMNTDVIGADAEL